MKITIDIPHEQIEALITLGVFGIGEPLVKEQIKNYDNVYNKIVSKADVCFGYINYLKDQTENSDADSMVETVETKINEMFFEESQNLFWQYNSDLAFNLLAINCKLKHFEENNNLLEIVEELALVLEQVVSKLKEITK